MKSMRVLLALAALFGANSSFAAEWLVKLARWEQPSQLQARLRAAGQNVMGLEDLRFGGWYLVRTATESWAPMEASSIGSKAQAIWVERNKRVRLSGLSRRLDGPIPDPGPPAADPEYQRLPPFATGADPLINQQWGLVDTGFLNVKGLSGQPAVVVAVIDTGVDYNHPDLNAAIWLNPGEAGPLAHNGIDDDRNGYVDDYMGWDFVENDNKPYDRTAFFGNAGHGTHCAGVIGATGGNGYGITGIASGVRIMALRFIASNGEGTTAAAVKAVKYAIDNGAWILSNSWGGEDEQNDDSRALREIFAEAHRRGRISVVAAENSSLNVDAAPMKSTPASFNLPSQITVAATGKDGSLASFSNYGATFVHLGAPGVGIYSTVPGGRFQSMDGTSMAAPMVAGAAALYWSNHLNLNFMDVRKAVLSSVTPTPALVGKTVTGGRLNIENLMTMNFGEGLRRLR